MARWGRTTDIEYVARVYLEPGGGVERIIIQGPGHKDIVFRSRFDGTHPVLMPVTDNNMVGEAADSPLRFQLAPVLVDLSSASRERIMDENPSTYAVMAAELRREGKFRDFGVVDGEKISDVRNYAHFEYKALHSNSALTVHVTLADGRGFASDLGRNDYAISRSGWVRTTVELPPGTKPGDIAGVGFACIAPPPQEKGGRIAHSGTCVLERVSKAFFLTSGYRPGPSWLSLAQPVRLPTGTSVLLKP
jgi:hypothetical protein